MLEEESSIKMVLLRKLLVDLIKINNVSVKWE